MHNVFSEVGLLLQQLLNEWYNERQAFATSSLRLHCEIIVLHHQRDSCLLDRHHPCKGHRMQCLHQRRV